MKDLIFDIRYWLCVAELDLADWLVSAAHWLKVRAEKRVVEMESMRFE